MSNAASLEVGTLLARAEAPTMFYRVTSRHPTYVRLMPYRFAGREVHVKPVQWGDATHWIGDGSTWTVCK